MRKAIAAALVALGLLAAGATAQELNWPQRQVTVIVPFGAGGTTDVFARIIAERLQQKYGRPFVVENRPGAGGNIGTGIVARSEPDGHTLLVGTVSTHAINPYLYRNLPYDTERDFANVSGIATLPNMLVVHPSVPARTLPEFIAYVRANAGSLNYASSGVGTSQHLAAELFARRLGVTITHVPYRSSNEIMQNIVGGHVQFAFDNITIAWPQARGGTVRALAVTSPERSFVAPDIPTVAEAIPGFDATSWNGLWVRAGTPQAIIDRLAADVREIMTSPEVQERARELASTPAPSSPAEFTRFIQAERAKWRELVNALDLRM
jgi:tripartite-type tricarboxylate transporter receptor subunit TctC